VPGGIVYLFQAEVTRPKESRSEMGFGLDAAQAEGIEMHARYVQEGKTVNESLYNVLASALFPGLAGKREVTDWGFKCGVGGEVL